MNWGNKLLFTFIVFAAGMFYLVYRSVTTNFELVEKDYYKQELRYQQVIDGTREANRLAGQVLFVHSEKGIRLQLPEEMRNKKISGEIWFYCAYDQKKDKKFSLETDKDAGQFFTPEQLQPGTYTVKISWKDEQKNYYSEKSLNVL